VPSTRHVSLTCSENHHPLVSLGARHVTASQPESQGGESWYVCICGIGFGWIHWPYPGDRWLSFWRDLMFGGGGMHDDLLDMATRERGGGLTCAYWPRGACFVERNRWACEALRGKAGYRMHACVASNLMMVYGEDWVRGNSYDSRVHLCTQRDMIDDMQLQYMRMCGEKPSSSAQISLVLLSAMYFSFPHPHRPTHTSCPSLPKATITTPHARHPLTI
jgi:hypothetical protein